jgi:hypothetical protein
MKSGTSVCTIAFTAFSLSTEVAVLNYTVFKYYTTVISGLAIYLTL